MGNSYKCRTLSFLFIMSNEATKKQYELSEAFKVFMDILWLDLNDDSLKDTPNRVAKMFINETCSGLFTEPPKITTFPNENHYDWMVVVKDIEVKSLCEHHFQPFIWKCHIAYLPKDKVVGLSKFSRVVDYIARRPQVQERLTIQIYRFLSMILETQDIAVVINSEHFCMKLRGVEEPCSSTATAKLGWIFYNDQKVREEFYNLIKL